MNCPWLYTSIVDRTGAHSGGGDARYYGLMAKFEIVDLHASTPTRSGERAPRALGSVSTSEIADQLVALRDEVDPIFEDGNHLKLKSITIKLAITAEGRVAFIARGTVDASVAVVFERVGSSPDSGTRRL